MKKIFLVAVMAVTAMAVNAQTTFGVKAGANFSNYKYE
ncbi:MAG: PorT family protein, partial [Chitinophagaceae bacterium]|nr:PorT family protein [Chitinophagaceae bacterium]